MTSERDLLRELEAALDVSPSPHFEARVRERVRMQSMRASQWTWAAGVAVTATVVVALVLLPGRLETVRHLQETPATSIAAPVLPLASTQHVARTEEPTVARARRSVKSAQDATELPVAVIPAGQAKAIERLMAEIAAGRIAIAPGQPGPPEVLEVTALSTAAPITFDPIRFKPLSADESPDLWR